jgi:hypothetical protein
LLDDQNWSFNKGFFEPKKENMLDFEKIKKEPYIQADDLIGSAVLKVYDRKETGVLETVSAPISLYSARMQFMNELFFPESVPVAQIISAASPHSWKELLDLMPSVYIDDLAKKIGATPSNTFLKEGLILINYQGAYISGGLGMHIAVAKLVGVENIFARVLRVSVDQVIAHDGNEYEMLLNRLEQDIWSGSLKKTNSSEGPYAIGQVERFSGPWAFAKDIFKAKKTYFEMGVEDEK